LKLVLEVARELDDQAQLPLAKSRCDVAHDPARLPIVIRSPTSSGGSRLKWPVAITSSPRRSSYR